MDGHMGVRRRHRRAVTLMAVAVMFFSTNALFIKLTLGEEDPFLYNAGIWVGMSLGLGGAAWLFYRPAFTDPATRRVLYRRVAGLKTDGVRRWDLIGLLWLGVGGRFAVAFFAWATQYVEAATVSVLHYTWPVIFILGLSRWDRSKRRRYRRVTGFSWTGLGLAFFGMAAVVIGTLGFDLTEADLAERVFGMVLALISALLLACNTAVGYPMSESLSSEIIGKTDAHPDEHRLEFGCLLFVGCVSGLLAIVPNLVIGWVGGGHITLATFGWAVAVGCTFVPGGVLARKAVLITPDLAVNALIYASPVVGLLWLGLFTDIIVARLDLLVAGSVLVAVANVLLNRPGAGAIGDRLRPAGGKRRGRVGH